MPIKVSALSTFNYWHYIIFYKNIDILYTILSTSNHI